MSNLIGQSLGRYHILEQLGEGGMATVYKAYDTRLETDVAVKVIRTDVLPQNAVERTLKRFEREAKSLARLTHPNIVKVMDYGENDGAPYLVLVYLPGGTLKKRMGQSMPWQEAVRLLIPIANALEYAHEHKVVHRDVKPANILLTEKGQPMLTDFGIAKILEMEDGHTLTGTGMGIGTPEYMSPEQGMGREVDGRADIYSMGIILYELITGRKPYTADTPMAVVVKHMTDPLPRPRQFVSDLPEAIEKVLIKSLAKDPRDRYPDAGAFVTVMEALLMGASQSVRADPTPRVNQPVEPDLETQDTYLQGETASTKSQTGRYTEAPQTMHSLERSQPKKTIWWPWVVGGIGLILAVITFIKPNLFSPAPTPAAATEAPAADPMADLVAAAQAEGTLTAIALPHDWCNYGEAIETFKAKYGLEVNELNPDAGSGDEIEAIKANKDNTGPQAPDVIDVSLAFGASSKAEGLIQPYKVSTWDSIPVEAKDADGYWYGDYYGVLSFLVNTDVQPEVPQDWADLLDPKYNGQVAMSGDPRTSSQAIRTVYAAALANGGSLDDAQPGLDYFAEMNSAGNLVPLISNNGLVATGETAVRITWDYNALAAVDSFEGNPAAEVVIPATGRFAGVYVQAISAYAPHPNAAKLWMEFLYSDEGQAIWMKGYCHPIREADMRERGVIPADLLAKLPDVSGAVFPTLDQLNAASALITANWDVSVGADIKAAP